MSIICIRPIKESEAWLGHTFEDSSWCCSRPSLSSPWLHSPDHPSRCQVLQHTSWRELWSALIWFRHCQKHPICKDSCLNICYGNNRLYWSRVCSDFQAQWEIRCLQFRHCASWTAHWEESCREWVQFAPTGECLKCDPPLYRLLHNLMPCQILCSDSFKSRR